MSVVSVKRTFSIPECNICFYPYNHTVVVPRVLTRCGHTVCQACIQTIKNYSAVIICPYCQIVTPVLNGYVHNLPKNTAVLKMIEETHTTVPVVTVVQTTVCNQAKGLSKNQKKKMRRKQAKVAAQEIVHMPEAPVGQVNVFWKMWSILMTWLGFTKPMLEDGEAKIGSTQGTGTDCEQCITELSEANPSCVLPCCGNTICQACVDKISGFFGVGKCPYCEQRCNWGRRTLPKNYLAEQMIDEMEIVKE